MEILIITGNHQIGSSMKGIGYRIWEISNILAHKGYNVHLTYNDNLSFQDLCPFDFIQIESIYNRRFDLVINFDVYFDIEPYNLTYNKYICDFLISNLELYTTQRFLELTSLEAKLEYDREKNGIYFKNLRKSDIILVGTQHEKAIFYGMLTCMNKIGYTEFLKDPTFNKKFVLLPISYSKDFNETKYRTIETTLSRKIMGSNYLVWNGGLWNHYNILNAIELITKNGDLKLVFPYTSLKTKTNNLNFLLELANENIILSDHNISFFERSLILKDALAFVGMGSDSYESYTTIRLRTRDTFLYSRPILTNKNSLLYETYNSLEIAFDLTEIGKIINKTYNPKYPSMIYEDKIDDFIRAIESAL